MGEKETYFLRGSTTQFVCQYDSRFSYCAYVPKQFREENKHKYDLAVIVHGSLRNGQQYRDAFIDFANEHDVIILAPFFPGGITEAWESDSYKFVRVDGVYYDQVLLAMVEEFTGKLGIDIQRFLLHGYSGGGQYVHRFYYLHPEKIMALSIGAPGNVTLIDETKPWVVGLKDYESIAGKQVPYELMQDVPVLMVIGAEDSETWMINDRKAPYWQDAFMDAGENRIDRLQTLRKSYEDNGIQVIYKEILGIGHEGFKILLEVQSFFSQVLERERK